MSAKLDNDIIQWCHANPGKTIELSVKELETELQGKHFGETRTNIYFWLGRLSGRQIEYTLVDDSAIKPPHYLFAYARVYVNELKRRGLW